MKRFIEFASYNFEHYDLKVYHNLPGMHAGTDIPSTACHLQRFLCSCISQAHISFCFTLWRICCGAWVAVSHGTYPYWMIQSFRVLWIITVSSNTLDPSEFVTCFIIGRKPSKGKTKGILLGKLIFPPSTCTWLFVLLLFGRDWRHSVQAAISDYDLEIYRFD